MKESTIMLERADYVEGRALWLSAYPDEQQEATRTNCMECNEWAMRLALELRH
jgi:hypothetical protein